jgi:rhodanese-related sulfurtransferase
MFFPQVPTVQATDLDPAKPVPPGTVLLDVREQDEWDAGHAPDAVHIPLGDLPERVGELDPDARVLVVCHSGARSARATAWLNQGGYDAANLDGGMVDWARAGLPVV